MRLALVLLLACAPALAIGPSDRPSDRTLVFGPQKFTSERIGTLTYLHCQPKDSKDCKLFERLEIQPQLDWDAFAAQAKKTRLKKAKRHRKARVLATQNAVDQHGGLWTFAWLAEGVVIVPDFKAYHVSFDDDGKILDVEVVEKQDAPN